MAPTFRSSRSGRQFVDNTVNRNRSGQVDHDVFEGLPVRRWSRQPYTFSQDPKLDVPDSSSDVTGANQSFPELPMPKDSHLLSPMSRALLRAARAGCIYIRHVNKEAEEEEKEPTEIGEPVSTTRVERSFTARKWTALPKHMEPPEVEFLAKRRPGLPSLYGASGTLNTAPSNVANNQPMRKTKVKKVDPTTGDVSIYEVWVPEGHTVEGEIKDDAEAMPEQKDATVTKQTPAPGTVVEGVGVANADGAVVASANGNTIESPTKRRGPPAGKRKGRGIGKGRRKRVMFAPDEGADAATVHGVDGAADERMAIDDPNGEQFEDEDEEDEEVEGEEETKEEEAALEAKSPDVAMQDSTTPATEQTATPVGPSAESQLSTSEPQPSSVAALPPEQQASEVPQAPSQELPDSSIEAVTSVQDATGTEQPSQELQQSKPPSPPVAAGGPVLECSPAVVEAPQDAPDNVQISQQAETVAEPTPLPVTEAMEGIEQTNTAERSQDIPEQAPALENAEVPGVEQTVTVGNPEAVAAAAEDSSQAPVPVTTAEVASAPAVSEAVPQSASTAGADGNVDLLGTIEASLGGEQVQVSPEQGGSLTTGPTYTEQGNLQTTTVLPPAESSSAPAPALAASTAPAPAPAPGISDEVKTGPSENSESQLQPQPQPAPEPEPEPAAKESVVAEEKKDEPGV
ncbi:hypothetical protein VTN77DRAFT_7825 [Rasamsonia byssochlamydoides]|uniref:uncharacterized protein n=1 Tax=Rasamsonia byssochlamydoides TaxID=89139 RepID=UPI0037447733